MLNESIKSLVSDFATEEKTLTENLLEKHDYSVNLIKNQQEALETFLKMVDENIEKMEKELNESSKKDDLEAKLGKLQKAGKAKGFLLRKRKRRNLRKVLNLVPVSLGMQESIDESGKLRRSNRLEKKRINKFSENKNDDDDNLIEKNNFFNDVENNKNNDSENNKNNYGENNKFRFEFQNELNCDNDENSNDKKHKRKFSARFSECKNRNYLNLRNSKNKKDFSEKVNYEITNNYDNNNINNNWSKNENINSDNIFDKIKKTELSEKRNSFISNFPCTQANEIKSILGLELNKKQSNNFSSIILNNSKKSNLRYSNSNSNQAAIIESNKNFNIILKKAKLKLDQNKSESEEDYSKQENVNKLSKLLDDQLNSNNLLRLSVKFDLDEQSNFCTDFKKNLSKSRMSASNLFKGLDGAEFFDVYSPLEFVICSNPEVIVEFIICFEVILI